MPSARLVACVSPRAPWLVSYFPCVCIFWGERGGGLTPPVGTQVDTAIIGTAVVLSTNRVDLGSFSSRCCTFRRTHTYERRPYLATLYPTSFTLDSLLALTICAQRKTVVCVSPRALWLSLSGDSSCDCLIWDKRGGGLTRQPVGPPVGTAVMTAVMGANRVNLGSFSSRCYAFRRTHTSADPIRLHCIRQALPLALSLPSRLAPSARLVVGVPPRALYGWRGFSYVERKYVRV